MAQGKLPQITKGFIASKLGHKDIEVKVTIFNLGFYISVMEGDRCQIHTNRTGDRAIQNTRNFISRLHSNFINDGWDVKYDKDNHYVKTDKDGFFITAL